MIFKNQKSVRSEAQPPRKGKIKNKKINSIFFLLVTIYCLPITICYAQETTTFYHANTLYEQGKYDEAITQYNDIITKNNLESGNLYYNLGNCYFKKGNLGQAILNYEKARRLIPFDKDLESNYEYANSLIKSDVVAPKQNFYQTVFSKIFEVFTINSLTISLNILYVITLITILLGIFLINLRKRIFSIVAFLILFFSLGFFALREKISLLNKEGIVITKTVDVKFEPINNATTYFTLHEGMKVKITATNENWYKIKRLDNKSGWVDSTALALY